MTAPLFAMVPFDPTEILVLGAVGLFGMGLFLATFGAVAWQARRRGYSFWVWMLACIFSLNPLLILVLLAMLPDARKKRLREREMEELQKKLAALPTIALSGDFLAVPAASLGDQLTTAPSALRSIGDEMTRM